MIAQRNAQSLSHISATLTQMFKPGFAEVLNEEATLWGLLPKRRTRAEAVRAKFRVGTRATDYQVYHSAYTDHAIYTQPMAISDFAQAKSMADGHGNYETWADEVARAATDMRRDLEGGLWGAQSGLGLLSILDALDDGSTVPIYLGLARADYPFLNCIYLDAGDGPISFALLRQLFRQIHHGTGSNIVGNEMNFAADHQGRGRVDVVLTTPKIETAYEALVTASKRYPIPPPANTRAEPGLADLIYKRAPVLGSRFSPDNNLFALDLHTWAIEILPQTLIDKDGQRHETDFALVIDGLSGQRVSVFWRVYFQLVCAKPWRNGRIVRLSHEEPTP